MKPTLHTLICSTRPGRIGPAIARWAHDAATADGRFDNRLVDLADFDLPVYDEPAHPRLRDYRHAHTREWSACVDAADAFVFVMPEYNYGPPPALLNAMTYLVGEWQCKPMAFVSYGGMSGGVRAVQLTKQLLTTHKLVPLLEAVAIPNVAQHVAQGRFTPNDIISRSASVMFDELHRWALALLPLHRDLSTPASI
ncbi:MAG TPA: NAD(P)H-dependent oxidoreductase [Ramlibacter sp.]|nr:NAD(P)H-dependent oxidoreductase [Ramlibacter sp.]